jgi:A/G-specific adenine glycosylase
LPIKGKAENFSRPSPAFLWLAGEVEVDAYNPAMLGNPRNFSSALLVWYDRHQRHLPWRAPTGSAVKIDPYHVLVSEAMLQQTQVVTALPYFERFIARFPTLTDLAAADEQDVLRLWQGLGYYARARNLRAAAQRVVAEYGGKIPANYAALQNLPGIGRYTAGAVGSIAFDLRVPLLDANVARVLCRIDRIETDLKSTATVKLLWKRAEEILPTNRVGDFNTALMELGALVCTPRSPKCLICPVNAHCQAAAAGIQEKIPAPRPAKELPLLRRWIICINDGEKYLFEQRPAKGRWAGMWQFVTIEAEKAMITAKIVKAATGCSVKNLKRIGEVTHGLTHRRYEFEVFAASCKTRAPAGLRKWLKLDEVNAYPLPAPHVKALRLLKSDS